MRSNGDSSLSFFQTMTPPHPCNFFSVRLALLGCTAGLHVALLRLCTGPCLARAHDKLCVSVIANQNSRFTYRQGVRFDRAPPHSRGRPSRPSRKPCLPSAGRFVAVSASTSWRSSASRLVVRTRWPCPSSSKPNGRTFTRTPAASSVCCVCCIWQRQARRPAHSLSSGWPQQLQLPGAVPCSVLLVSPRLAPAPADAQR